MADLRAGWRRAPRWVKVFAVVGLVLVVVLVAALQGGHGPGRHG